MAITGDSGLPSILVCYNRALMNTLRGGKLCQLRDGICLRRVWTFQQSRRRLFNEVYDKEHVPLLNNVPGVVSVARFKRQELTLAIGGELQTIVVEDEPVYSAIYEVESR